MRRFWLFLGIVLLGATAVFVHEALEDPEVAVTTHEVIPPGEEAATARLVHRAMEVITEESKPDHFYKRDAHAKPHGCVRAVMTVNEDIPEELRHGVFSEPGRVYRAWARYSNGTKPDDRERDARGMAVKLLGVPGCKLLWKECDEATQDFVMIDYHTFFNRNVMEYEKFFNDQAAGHPERFFLPPRRWHEAYHAFHMLHQTFASPLAPKYYSMTAYKLGPHQNIKFSAQPCAVDGEAAQTLQPFALGAGNEIIRDTQACAAAARKPDDADDSPNFLRRAMVKHLEKSCACFDFKVQLQDPSKNMPIEDPSIEWRTSDSPYRPIARLIVLRQAFNSDRQNRFCENLSFTPWHALPEHRPVGGLNRVRKAVYANVSIRRHARNGAPRREPTGWDIDLADSREILEPVVTSAAQQ